MKFSPALNCFRSYLFNSATICCHIADHIFHGKPSSGRSRAISRRLIVDFQSLLGGGPDRDSLLNELRSSFSKPAAAIVAYTSKRKTRAGRSRKQIVVLVGHRSSFPIRQVERRSR